MHIHISYYHLEDYIVRIMLFPQSSNLFFRCTADGFSRQVDALKSLISKVLEALKPTTGHIVDMYTCIKLEISYTLYIYTYTIYYINTIYIYSIISYIYDIYI